MSSFHAQYIYKINDFKDKFQDKLLDFFVVLRREIKDEDLKTQNRHRMKKIK